MSSYTCESFDAKTVDSNQVPMQVQECEDISYSWDTEELADAKKVWPAFATGVSFETVAEECGGAGDCFFYCLAVGFFRAAEFSRNEKLRVKYARGAKGMNAVRSDFAKTVTVQNAMRLGESLIDGALSDNCRVRWLNKLRGAIRDAKMAQEGDATKIELLQACLRNMMCTPGSYFQGTDLLLRHYVSCVSSETDAKGEVKSRLFADIDTWTSQTLPDVGFLVMIDAFPGICELIGGLHKRFYIVLVNYGNMHWRLGYIRTREDKEEDPNAPYCCVIEKNVALRVLELSDQARRQKAIRH